ncbi:hypothetical protein CKM354_000076500 [Cercospora kikuchii]|uniref:Heterokaryon incompatibility domain-containing protein n=1 Tax=Cercospora kikuchii TaxID=84275 RepID=A0A9P3CC25_9PEZI|nr:uncharacterized protein CKM354_000076500 [Cercospora kikuchii]GIZ37315.1 hypothetical protein CKM354_000076500 [Cercospora kikuchii]
MRLINTTTLQFREFLGAEIPLYAILSHVWSDSEISYEDYTAGRKQDGYGYQKITKICELARETYKLDWAWVDTCCIDKRSSAELSEAINSMFEWYSKSTVCLVFLPDVHELSQHDLSNVAQLRDHYEPTYPWYDDRGALTQVEVYTDKASFVKSGEDIPFAVEEFLQSKWFTRGWTLQELIAPRTVDFYNTSFQKLGHCDKNINDSRYSNIEGLSLHVLVQSATSIAREYLWFARSATPSCIAQRMSWAAKRTTTRPEDVAYCLLGLFGVNMPLLYGEGGEKAFERLQLELLSQGTDQSLFMWQREGYTDRCEWHIGFSLLAPSPAHFYCCTDATSEPAYIDHLLARSVFKRTQRGLETEVTLPRGLLPPLGSSFWLLYPLCCSLSEKRLSCYLLIDVRVSHKTYEVRYADGALSACGLMLLQLDKLEERRVLQHVLRNYFFVDNPLYESRRHAQWQDFFPSRGLWQTIRDLRHLCQRRRKIKLYFPPAAKITYGTGTGMEWLARGGQPTEVVENMATISRLLSQWVYSRAQAFTAL